MTNVVNSDVMEIVNALLINPWRTFSLTAAKTEILTATYFMLITPVCIVSINKLI